MVDTPMSR